MRNSLVQYARPLSFNRCRSAIFYGLVCFSALQVILACAIEFWALGLRDPEFFIKVSRLHDRSTESPERPLLLALGSSRLEMGFTPRVLCDELPAAAKGPVVVNLGITGAGPLMELVCLRRLLSSGVRPRWVIIEVLLPLLHQFDKFNEFQWLNLNRLGWDDVSTLTPYAPEPWFTYRHWVRSALTPWFSHRLGIMNYVAPALLSHECRWDEQWVRIDDWGWLPYHKSSVTIEEYQRGVAYALKEYVVPLYDFHVTQRPDRALREILDLCRKEHIRGLLLLMPEGSEFRNLYSPEARIEIDAYLANLSHEYQVPVIDTRLWLPDSAFWDGHHLLPDAAAAFTRRLGREVLVPLLGWHLPAVGSSIAAAMSEHPP